MGTFKIDVNWHVHEVCLFTGGSAKNENSTSRHFRNLILKAKEEVVKGVNIVIEIRLSDWLRTISTPFTTVLCRDCHQ